MKISKTLMTAAFGLTFGLSAGPALAQDFASQMDDGQWHRFEEHIRKVQHQIDAEAQNGALNPVQAVNLERILDDANLHANLQRFDQNGGDHVPFWDELHRVHQALGGSWEPEFDRH